MTAEADSSIADSKDYAQHDLRYNKVDSDADDICTRIQASENEQLCLTPDVCPNVSASSIEMKQSSNHLDRYQGLANHLCAVAADQVAVWQLSGHKTLLCAFTATVLMYQGLIKEDDLILYDGLESINRRGAIDPLSGGTIALLGSVGDAMKNIANIPTDVIRAIRSPPESQSIDQTLEDTSTIPTGKPRDKASKAAIATSKNVGRVLETSLTAPMAFTLGMSQGFRNVPRLYGEKSRPVDNVTGWQSGLKTAGKEFSRGMYDGLSGIVTDPYRGACAEGGAGMLKGLGRGFAGVVAKPGAAIFALPAYTLQGIHRSIHSSQNGRDTGNFRSELRAAYLKQGQLEYNDASEEERDRILMRWAAISESEDDRLGKWQLGKERAK